MLVERVMRLVFPASWVNKDTVGAVTGVVLVSLVLSAASALLFGLFGCAGGRVYGEYEHHSSVPTNDDLNTTDQIGLCVAYQLNEHPYAPNMEVCLHKELDSSKPVFGPDPVGTIRIQQPLYKW